MAFHSSFSLPLALHISDGVLAGPWLLGGFGGAASLVLFGAWRIHEDEIPSVALLTAAFFAASSLRLPLGPSSAHLLLNGLVGAILGRRAALAIPVGLLMQAVLLGHGGYSTLGVNSCMQIVPALLAWQGFAGLRRMPWVRRPWFGICLVEVSILAWGFSLVYSVALLWHTLVNSAAPLDDELANRVTFHPYTLAIIGLLSIGAAWGYTHLASTPEFPLGLLVGELSVLLTVVLQCVVLIWGGAHDWRTWALIELVAHIPIAVVEGIVLGFTVGYLARVKPEMLGWQAVKEPA